MLRAMRLRGEGRCQTHQLELELELDGSVQPPPLGLHHIPSNNSSLKMTRAACVVIVVAQQAAFFGCTDQCQARAERSMQASVHNGRSLPRRSGSRPGVVDVVGGSFQNGVVSNVQGRRQHGLLKLDIPSSQSNAAGIFF